jgi:hypothetical protein
MQGAEEEYPSPLRETWSGYQSMDNPVSVASGGVTPMVPAELAKVLSCILLTAPRVTVRSYHNDTLGERFGRNLHLAW